MSDFSELHDNPKDSTVYGYGLENLKTNVKYK
jgi:hypothetical protein